MGGALKHTTLCFVFDRARDSLLMIEKKRGQGAGKWNVPGGKIGIGEAAVDAAVRETFEETGLRPSGLQEVGRLEFYFPADSSSWDNTCTVFTAEAWTGLLVAENDECRASWVPLSALPFEKMWDNDRLWIPLLLAGKPFHRIYRFDGKDRMVGEEIIL